jgi:protein arginine kinase activator
MSDYEIKDQIFNSCSSCETSLFEIKKHKKFGCANCYVHFKDYAERYFSVCQVGTKHIGKVPSLSNSLTIDQLGKKMNEAIVEENYELANEYKKIIAQKSN